MTNEMKSDSRKRVTSQIWLKYFNNYLHEKGVISEEEKNRMATKIELAV